MITDLPKFDKLHTFDLEFEPLRLSYEALMFELEPLPQISLLEFEPYKLELPKLDFIIKLLAFE